MFQSKQEHSFIVQSVVQESSQVRSYRCEFGWSPKTFLPGQFCVVRLPSQPEKRASLTYSSAPDQSDFELTVKRVGDFGTRWYDEVKVGDVFAATPPAGTFALRPEQIHLPLCYIGRDYCVPAARSFVRWLASQRQTFDLTILHELSESGEGLFESEFQAQEGLRYRQIVARPVLASDLEELSQHRFFSQAEGLDARRYRDLLLSCGVSKERMMVERWS